MRLVEVGGTLQALRPIADGPGSPVGLRGKPDIDGRRDLLGRGFGNLSHDLGGIGRIDGLALLLGALRARHRSRLPDMRRGELFTRLPDLRQRRHVGEVPAPRIHPALAENLARLGNGRIAGRALVLDDGERIARDRLGTDLVVDDLVDEGGVGAVFEQPPHQIGEQVLVLSDRRVDAAARAFRLAHRLVKRLAHAVKPLELEARAIFRHVQYRGDGVGVVRGKLRIDAVGHRQQLARAGDVGNVRIRLAREHRIAVEPHHLGALDFGIPVGPLHEPHHDLAVETARERVKPVDHMAGARPVCLDHNAEPVPVAERRMRHHRLDHVERQVEPVGFLGIDVEAHARRMRLLCERQETLGHHRQHGLALRHLVTRMESGKLDRDAGIAARVGAGRAGVQCRDRVGIGAMIAHGVGFRPRRLAEHVVGVEIALGAHRPAAPDRLLDRAAEHELLAHLAHRSRHGGADHRFAKTPHHATEGPLYAAVALFEHTPRQHKRPCRGVDEDRRRFARMRRPVVRNDLVGDEIVHRRGVGNPEKSLRKAHQRDAFARRQPVLGEERLHHVRVGRLADLAHEVRRARRDRLAPAFVQIRHLDQPAERRPFVRKIVLTNPGAKPFQFPYRHAEPRNSDVTSFNGCGKYHGTTRPAAANLLDIQAVHA